jgi:predicted permease
VSGRVPQSPNLLSGTSFPEFEFLADGVTTATLAAERRTTVALDDGRGARPTRAYVVTGNYFDLLGARMHLGRGFFPHEGTGRASARVVVLGYSLWQTRFGGDPSIVGRTVHVGPFTPNVISRLSEPHTVVGVASREFTGGDGSSTRVWLPLSSWSLLRDESEMLDNPNVCCVEVFARVDQDATRAQLGAELQALSDRFRRAAAQMTRPIVLGGTQFFRGRRGDSTALAVIGVLFLGILLLLLLACANVGNLLLARAAVRRGEIAVRLSLGAGRARIVRALLTEGFVLALLAAGVGLAIAAWLPRVVWTEIAEQPAPFAIDVDVLVLGYGVALAALACVACALAPALHATRGDILTALKGVTPFLDSRLPLRSAFLAVQVAMTVVLLTSAGLLLRGVAAARELDLGFPLDDISEASIGFPQPDYDAGRMQALLPDVTAALASAGLTSFAFAAPGRATEEARRPGDPENQSRPVDRVDASPSYFDVVNLPLTAGRSFVESDRGRDVAVVNETLARQLWRGENPVGRSLVTGARTYEIIGVVRDARLLALDPVLPIYFQPLTGPRGAMFPVVLFRNQPSGTAAITGAIARLEPLAQVTVAPLRTRFDTEIERLTLAPLAASTLGLLGLGLATVGMFGVFAFAVRQRTREIGIRIALGAPSRDVVLRLLAGSARALVVGLIAGVLGALGASQLLRSLLYGLSPLDPATYGSVALLLATAAMLASYVPARRAAHINPTEALRE